MKRNRSLFCSRSTRPTAGGCTVIADRPPRGGPRHERNPFSLMLMACSTLLLLSSGAPASAADAPRSYVKTGEAVSAACS